MIQFFEKEDIRVYRYRNTKTLTLIQSHIHPPPTPTISSPGSILPLGFKILNTLADRTGPTLRSAHCGRIRASGLPWSDTL